MLKHSTHNNYLFAAVLVKGGRVISTGVNKMAAPKRFTRPHRKNMALHCEISAILGLDKSKTKNTTLVINGTTAAGNLACTKPCQTCLTALETAGVRRIVYMDKGTVREIV